MKRIGKKVAAGVLAMSLAAGGMMLPTSTAHALSLGSIGSALGGVAGGGVDVEGLNSRQSRMLENLYYSVALLQAATENINIATNDSITNKNLITASAAAKSAQKSSDAGLNMKNGAEQTKKDMENAQSYLSTALNSGDEEKLKAIDSAVRVANTERLLSDTMGGVAAGEAIKIVASTLKALKNPGELAGKIDQFSKTAKETQALLKVRSELSKALSMATKDYRAKRGIKDPSKAEIKQTSDEIVKE